MNKPNNGVEVNCDPATRICTAKVSVRTGRAYRVPEGRVGPTMKGVVGDAPYLGFGLELRTRQVDRSDRTVLFVASTPAPDRMGDVIEQEGWDLKNFRRNPVVLWAHDSWSMPIGRGKKVFLESGQLMLLAEFATEAQFPFAETVFKMIEGGFVNAVSVGFMPKLWQWLQIEDEEGNMHETFGIRFIEQELLEISVVPVPANQEALVVGRGFEEALKSVEMAGPRVVRAVKANPAIFTRSGFRRWLDSAEFSQRLDSGVVEGGVIRAAQPMVVESLVPLPPKGISYEFEGEPIVDLPKEGKFSVSEAAPTATEEESPMKEYTLTMKIGEAVSVFKFNAKSEEEAKAAVAGAELSGLEKEQLCSCHKETAAAVEVEAVTEKKAEGGEDFEAVMAGIAAPRTELEAVMAGICTRPPA